MKKLLNMVLKQIDTIGCLWYKKIKAISNLNNFNYINVYDSLLDKNKNLNINYTTDGIHLNDQGYQIYSKMINKNIKRR